MTEAFTAGLGTLETECSEKARRDKIKSITLQKVTGRGSPFIIIKFHFECAAPRDGGLTQPEKSAIRRGMVAGHTKAVNDLIEKSPGLRNLDLAAIEQKKSISGYPVEYVMRQWADTPEKFASLFETVLALKVEILPPRGTGQLTPYRHSSSKAQRPPISRD